MIDRTSFDYVDEQLGGFKAGSRCVFSIVGLTATGKTDLALALAEYVLRESPHRPRFKRVDIISADSRQVFRAIPLLSGADVPGKFVSSQDSALAYPYYVTDGVFLHGIGILDTTDEWSVSHFQTFAQQIMDYSWNHGGLVLLVGGTGLYHAHVFNEEMQLQPGPNFELRKQVEHLSVDELTALVKEKNFDRWQTMNESDRANPRRLIRVLEASLVDLNGGLVAEKSKKIKPDLYKTIMLQGDFEVISQKIAKRVQQRIELGAIQEVQELVAVLAEGSDLDSTGSSVSKGTKPNLLTATGVREIQQYLNEKMDLDQAIQAWIAREIKYAKHQLTWWKSHPVDFVIEV